jgi:hypothetical protein
MLTDAVSAQSGDDGASEVLLGRSGEQETGIISLLDARHILVKSGDYDLRLG